MVLSGREGPLAAHRALSHKSKMVADASCRYAPSCGLPGGLSRPALAPPPPTHVTSRALPRGGTIGGGAAGDAGLDGAWLAVAFSWPPGLREDTMSGVSRRLLWAATCLAALCVSAAQNITSPPNVTETPTVTPKPVTTNHTPTTPPGGRPPHGPTTRWDPRNMAARPDGWGAKAAGRARPRRGSRFPSLGRGRAIPKRLVTPRRSSGRRRGLLPRWQLGGVGRGDA